MFGTHFLFLRYGDHRDLHVPTHSFPTRLTSDLDRARRGAETGIGAVGAAGPFPHAAEHLLQVRVAVLRRRLDRSEEHTSELQSLMRISYAVFCLKKKLHSIEQRKIIAYTQLQTYTGNILNNTIQNEHTPP